MEIGLVHYLTFSAILTWWPEGGGAAVAGFSDRKTASPSAR